MPQIYVPNEIKERFFASTLNVIINGIEHRLWTKSKDQGGYGRFKWNGITYRAHRFSWFIEYGEFPKHHCLHKNECHTRPCVLIDHLYDGTPKQNSADSLALGTAAALRPEWHLFSENWHRGRKRSPEELQHMSLAQRGENHPNARMTEAKVYAIRAAYDDGISSGQLAEQYGLKPRTIWAIVARKIWKHI